MRGIILAAGKGSRLNGTAGDAPKCLLRVGDRTLIERQIATLRSAGIDEIVIVVGCQANRVQRVCGADIEYVENEIYGQTNSLYSLWLARPYLLDGFVVMNCDVLLHPQLLVDLVTARYEDALLLSYVDELPGDEEMKVTVRQGRVRAIAKTLAPEEADGENVGVVKFGPEGARLLADCLDARVADGGLRDWAPRAFGDFAQQRPLYAISTRGLPWTEIDFPEDYQRAVSEILPAIEADEAIRAGAVQAREGRTADTTVIVRGIRLEPDTDLQPDGGPGLPPLPSASTPDMLPIAPAAGE